MTDVLFRITKAKPGALVAVLPHVPAGTPSMCMSMDSEGKLHPCTPELIAATSRPATPKEYKPMIDLLTQAGYQDIRVRLRLHRADKDIRASKAGPRQPMATREADAAGIDRLADAIRAIVADEVARVQSEQGAIMRAAFEQAMTGAVARH